MNAPFVTPTVEAGIDPRLVFLERAAARLQLLNAGEIDLVEAIDGLGVSLHCDCHRELHERWERDYPLVEPKTAPKRQPPQSTLNAALFELRTYGIAQLEKPNCQRRLADLSNEQIRKLIEALSRLQPNHSAITSELISTLRGML